MVSSMVGRKVGGWEGRRKAIGRANMVRESWHSRYLAHNPQITKQEKKELTIWKLRCVHTREKDYVTPSESNGRTQPGALMNYFPPSSKKLILWESCLSAIAKFNVVEHLARLCASVGSPDSAMTGGASHGLFERVGVANGELKRRRIRNRSVLALG